MSHTLHELRDEFPDMIERLHELKVSDPRFAALADGYHDLNRTIHRMEAEIEPVADAVLEDLKKQRLGLKDRIAAMLAPA